MKKKIIVIGGGFGGLSFCQNIDDSKFEVTLIDKTNHHLFQPLLYQVAIAGLAPSDIAYPLRTILANKKIKVIYGEVLSVDFKNNKVILKDFTLDYDHLIVASGVTTNFYQHTNLKKQAFELKSIEDSINLRNHLLKNLEEAESEKKPYLLNFVVCGGGPTGVELSGAICELVKNTVNHEFKNINPEDINVYLVERNNSILTGFPEKLQKKAINDLKSLGVKVLLEETLKSFTDNKVILNNQEIYSNTLIWVAGVRGVDFIGEVPKTANNKVVVNFIGEVPKTANNKVVVNKKCQSVFENVYFIGDIAHFETSKGILPGVSPVAIQQGQYVAKRLNTNIEEDFSYWDKGNMATIGRNKAIADFYLFTLSGQLAWFAWLLVHLLFLIGFRNKISVVINWVYSYFSYKKGSRLITK
jgi:NADH dehydrogenase